MINIVQRFKLPSTGKIEVLLLHGPRIGRSDSNGPLGMNPDAFCRHCSKKDGVEGHPAIAFQTLIKYNHRL